MVSEYTFLLLICGFTFAVSTTTVSSGRLKCRVCRHARDLSECNIETYCDPGFEECYMEELITEQLQVVFNGGCRAIDVCRQSASGIIGRRDVDTVACSRCCGGTSGCNVHLCGITNPVINMTQCYSCGGGGHFSDQSQSGSSGCTTLATCQDDEMCYIGESSIAGTSENTYGCQRKQICALLMRQVFSDMDRCYQNPDPALCGAGHRRSSSICHSCCGNGACNSGNCRDNNERLYLLYKHGKLDMTTLTVTP